jgi:hypothetical protein
MAFSGETEEVVLTVNGIKKVSGNLDRTDPCVIGTRYPTAHSKLEYTLT